MREIIGVAASAVLFYFSNRMGTVIKLTGRGWKQPYRAYYQLVSASRRARTWGQRVPRSVRESAQFAGATSDDNGAEFSPFRDKTIIPMVGRRTGLASSGREADLFSDLKSSKSSAGNENALCRGNWSHDIAAKPCSQHIGQT